MNNSMCKEVPEDLQGTWKLTDLEISFVSACPQGANPGAKVLLKKEKIPMPDNKETQVNVQIDMDALSKSMSENLKKVMSDMLAKDKNLSAEAMTEAVVAVITGDLTAMQKSLNDDLQKAIDDVQKEIDSKIADAVKKTETVTKGADEELQMNGVTFKKSAVGDDVFKAIKASHEEQQRLRKEMEHERQITRVEKEFANVAGAPSDKAALLTLIEKADDNVKKIGLEVLKALNEAGKAFKKEDGTSETNVEGSDVTKMSSDNDASLKLDKMAEELAAKEGITKAAAYAKVLDTPEGTKLYEQHRSA